MDQYSVSCLPTGPKCISMYYNAHMMQMCTFYFVLTLTSI